MAHNPTIVLTAAQKDVATQVRKALADRQYGDKVEVNFVKRDQSESTIVGHIVGIVGENDKEAVTLMTDKGHRSANLWAVKSLRVL